MARYDVKLKSPIVDEFSTTLLVAAGAATSILAGEPTKGADAAAANPWTGAVAIMADGNGTTAQRFTGIAKSDSTDTVAAAGSVQTYLPLPGLIYSAKAKTSTTADTAAEVLALYGKRVVFDLTSSKWTVDAAAADALTNCVTIVGGEHQTATLFFTYMTTGSIIGNLTA
jgi:hypothetical protein